MAARRSQHRCEARRHRVSDFQHLRHAQVAKRGTDGRGLRMCAGHCDEADAIVSQRIDRMPLVGPLDQRRNQALAGQVSVIGDGDAP